MEEVEGPQDKPLFGAAQGSRDERRCNNQPNKSSRAGVFPERRHDPAVQEQHSIEGGLAPERCTTICDA